VRSVTSCGPYRHVPRTDGLECPNFVLGTRKLNISFTFVGDGLTRIQLWFYEGQSEAQARQATTDMLAYLSTRGPLHSNELANGAPPTADAIFRTLRGLNKSKQGARVQILTVPTRSRRSFTARLLNWAPGTTCSFSSPRPANRSSRPAEKTAWATPKVCGPATFLPGLQAPRHFFAPAYKIRVWSSLCFRIPTPAQHDYHPSEHSIVASLLFGLLFVGGSVAEAGTIFGFTGATIGGGFRWDADPLTVNLGGTLYERSLFGRASLLAPRGLLRGLSQLVRVGGAAKRRGLHPGN